MIWKNRIKRKYFIHTKQNKITLIRTPGSYVMI